MVGRTEATAQGAQLVCPGLASVGGPGLTSILDSCMVLLRDMPHVASLTEAFRSKIVSYVAQQYIQYFRASGGRFECVQAIETALDVPRVKTTRIHFCFGQQKGFPGVAHLADIAEHDVSVHVEGGTHIGATLPYSNHCGVALHSDTIIAKILTTYGLGGQSFFRTANRTPSPACGSLRCPCFFFPSQTRIIHDLTFSSSQ